MQDLEPVAFEHVARLRQRGHEALAELRQGLHALWARREGLGDAPQFAVDIERHYPYSFASR